MRLYDFARPDKFCKEHLRALNAIHAKHATLLAVALASTLRVDVQVNLLALDQLTFREYCSSGPDWDAVCHRLVWYPLTAPAIFEFNPSLVFWHVDLLAGGFSVSTIGATKLTEIDKAVYEAYRRALLEEIRRCVGR